MDRKGGESILGYRAMSGAIIATPSAHPHLDSRVEVVPGDSLHPFMLGTGYLTGKSTRHDKKIEGMYS